MCIRDSSQAAALAKLAQKVREESLTVMVFSGFTLKTLQSRQDPATTALLTHTDLLVDGPFIQTQLDRQRRWIGSQNQRPHALSGAYQQLVDDWDTSPNTLEIRVVNGRLVVNGSPFLLDKFGTKKTL